MIDLTPLDVRNKRGDFRKALRGYEPQEVDIFLELVAERLESLVRENLQLQERTRTLEMQVSSQTGREQAVQEALVTAQALRTEIQEHAKRQADQIIAEAETERRRMLAEAEAEVRRMFRDAERRIQQGQEALTELERRRRRFLKAFRQLLERELDVVEVEEEREPLDERPVELELGPPPAAEWASTPAPEMGTPEEEPVEEPDADALADVAPPVADPAAATELADVPLSPEAPVDELAEAYGAGAGSPGGDDVPEGEDRAEGASDPSATGPVEAEELSFRFDADDPDERSWP